MSAPKRKPWTYRELFAIADQREAERAAEAHKRRVFASLISSAFSNTEFGALIAGAVVAAAQREPAAQTESPTTSSKPQPRSDNQSRSHNPEELT